MSNAQRMQSLQPARQWAGVGRVWTLLALLIGLGAAAGAAPLKSYDEVVTALPHGDAAGQVLDADSKPVADAEVFLYYEAGFAGYRDRLAGRVKSDAQGEFKFEQAVAWEPLTAEGHRSFNPKYDVIARHPMLGMGYAVFKQNDPTEGLEITLEPTKPFVMSVKDAEGKPIEGARIHLNNIPKLKKSLYTEADYNVVRLRLNIGLVSGQTGKDGQVTLESIPGSGFTALKEGYTKAFSTTTFTLHMASPLTGRVLGPDGKPIAGIPVWVNYSGKPTGCSEYAVTDAEGRYAYPHFPTPPAGTKGTASLAPEDNRAGSQSVIQNVTFEVKPGEKITRDLTLKRGVRFAGKVVSAATGQPVANMRLYYVIGESGGILKPMQADAQGRFEMVQPAGSKINLYMEPSRSGDYILDREQSGRQFYSTRLTQDTSDVVLKVRVWPVRPLRGRVLTAEGKPAPNCTIYMHSNVPPVKSGPDGRFTLKVAPTDRDFDLLALDAEKKSGALAHCKAGAAEATLKLDPLHDYTGKALTPAGLPADNLKFSLYPALNETTLSDAVQQLTTDGEGTFSVKGLLSKVIYKASWSADNTQNRDYDYGQATIELSSMKPGEPITFTAKKYDNALMGKVVNENDKPIEGATITVESRELQTQDVDYNKRYTSDKNGNFTIERLAAGKAQIQVMHKNYRPRTLVTPSDNIECVVKLGEKSAAAVTRFVVVDEQDQPVEGAAVKFLGRSGSRGENAGLTSPTMTLKTDDKGVAEYRMTPPPDNPAGLLGRMIGQMVTRNNGGIYCCDAKGYDLAFGRTYGGADAEFLVRLTKSGKGYRGQVVDEQHRPMAGATVELTGWSAKGSRSLSYLNGSDTGIGISAVTDKEGRFAFPRINPECNLGFAVSAKGFAKSTQSVFEGNEGGTVFVLSRPALLEGKVVDQETGKPVGGGTIHAFNYRQGGSMQTKIEGDGSFRLEGLNAGDYSLSYQPMVIAGMSKRYTTEETPTVTVESGLPAKVTVEVVEAIQVQGKLVDPKTGQAPKGQYYLQVSRTDGAVRRNTLYGLQEDGRWFSQLPAGTYQFSAVPRNDMGRIQEAGKAGKTLKLEKGKSYNDVVIEVTPEAKK